MVPHHLRGSRGAGGRGAAAARASRRRHVRHRLPQRPRARAPREQVPRGRLRTSPGRSAPAPRTYSPSASTRRCGTRANAIPSSGRAPRPRACGCARRSTASAGTGGRGCRRSGSVRAGSRGAGLLAAAGREVAHHRHLGQRLDSYGRGGRPRPRGVHRLHSAIAWWTSLRRGVAGAWWPIRSSKPAGRRSPAVGRFDSFAAPLGGPGHPLRPGWAARPLPASGTTAYSSEMIPVS